MTILSFLGVFANEEWTAQDIIEGIRFQDMDKADGRYGQNQWTEHGQIWTNMDNGFA